MLKQFSLAALLTTALATAYGGPTIGGATLVDPATVHAGTITPTGYLTYLSGGDLQTGTADGTTYTLGATGSAAAAAAMAGADHVWLQFDPTIFMSSGRVALTSLLAVPAIDHGWTSGNTGEFWEPFEFRIWGCTAAVLSACTEGHITDVYTRGVDDTGVGKNADDWASVWAFGSAYSIFAITSGDRLVGSPAGGFSGGEGEIDALAITTPVPEPETFALLAGGLALMAFVARRRRER